ncbi:MAG TPA: hypothetical protein VF656_18150 [Pyrinomonadaceae bacterium]|jgi:hypothetical protein
MSTPKSRSHKPITIEQLYPELTPEEQQEAAYWLGRYLAIIRQIFERLQREKEQNLTGSGQTDMI